MSEEADPNQTTQFEVSKTGIKVVSKRMSELVAILSLLALGVQSAFTWQLYREVGGLTLAIRAEFADLKVKQTESGAAQRELACVALLSSEERKNGNHNCRTLSRLP